MHDEVCGMSFDILELEILINLKVKNNIAGQIN